MAMVKLDRAVGVTLGEHGPLRERQFHMWWRTSVIDPTRNTEGVLGNDFPSGYIYDEATHTEYRFHNVGILTAFNHRLDMTGGPPIRKVLELQFAANSEFFPQTPSGVPVESLPTTEYPFSRELENENSGVGEVLQLPYLARRAHGAGIWAFHASSPAFTAEVYA